jgi:hypothetical protein
MPISALGAWHLQQTTVTKAPTHHHEGAFTFARQRRTTNDSRTIRRRNTKPNQNKNNPQQQACRAAWLLAACLVFPLSWLTKTKQKTKQNATKQTQTQATALFGHSRRGLGAVLVPVTLHGPSCYTYTAVT